MSDTPHDTGGKEIKSLTEQLLHAYEELDLLHGVCEILSTSADPDEANKHILREAMLTLEAELGWIVYDDGPHSSRQVWRQNVDARTAAFLNEAVVNDAIAGGQHVWTDDLAHDLTAPNLKLPKAFLCVPLKTGNEILGAICLGKHLAGAVFTAGDLKLVQILCAPAANALLHRRVERAGELKRYVSPQIADSILRGGDVQLTNKRAELTMFLAELKGFTEAAEEMEPEELVAILNEYLSAMTDIVFAHEGTLDKFVLGSIFGFFGDPVAQDDHALRAVRMAEQMQRRFSELLKKWRSETSKPLGLGIGINTGYVTVGHIGSSNRTDYTAVGKNVVVAATLAGLAERGQILIGQRTYTKVQDSIPAEYLSTRDIGTQPMKIFRIEGAASDRSGSVARSRAPLSASGSIDHRAVIGSGAISHYRILDKLGEGGMGEVYRAEDLRLDRTVALKILTRSGQDEEARRRFVQEAKALSALNHPNIATIYEIDESRGVHFIAMEYIGGRTLREILDDGTALPIAQALGYAIPVAEALANAHDKSIVHRDIKPNNIMVSPEGYVKVLDFGLAKLVVGGADADHTDTTMVTRAGTLWGTVGYMSPEQAMGVTLDHRSDIFSFGVVLYELVTGQPPFAGNHAMAILHAVTFEPPTPISRLRAEAAGELERVVNKMLQKKAGDRYQHMKDTIVDLKRLQKDLTA